MKVSQFIELAKAHMETHGDTPIECVSSGKKPNTSSE